MPPAGRAIAVLGRPSRSIGLALLAIGLVLQLWSGEDGLAWRNPWFDLLHITAPRERPADPPVVIVAIDEETMQLNGHWPWPRDRLAVLVHRIGQLGARVVALDILLSNPDPQSPLRMAAEYRALGLEEAAAALEQVGDTDEVLFQALRGTPVVLPVAGMPAVAPLAEGQGCGFPAPPVGATAPLPPLEADWGDAEAPLPMLTEQASGLAELGLGAIAFSSERGFVLRRVPVVQRICGNLVLMLGAEALRLTDGATLAAVRPGWAGLDVVLGDPADPDAPGFPAESDGTFWLHFGSLGGAGEIGRRYISAQALFAEDFDPARIAGKVVLLAVIDLGRIDERMSPLGEVVYGVEAHAQMIEQILAGDFLRRPWFMPGIESLLLLLGGLAVVAVVPAARPERAVAAIAAGLLALLGAGYAAFLGGWLLDAASPAIGVTFVSAGVISATLIERDRARLLSELSLVTERADRALLQGEMDAAARIQMSILPPSRLHQAGVDLCCHLAPARTVGGDFYDYAVLPGDRLFVTLGDVAGKGAEASQFMLLCKALIDRAAREPGRGLGAIIADANNSILHQNTVEYFATACFVLLDVGRGRLQYSSAGHDQAIVRVPGGSVSEMPRRGAPPLGIYETDGFETGEIRLEPGSQVIMYSDGVTECTNPAGEMFGHERLMGCLAESAARDSDATLLHLLNALAVFSDGAERADDISVMVLTFSGRAADA